MANFRDKIDTHFQIIMNEVGLDPVQMQYFIANLPIEKKMKMILSVSKRKAKTLMFIDFFGQLKNETCTEAFYCVKKTFEAGLEHMKMLNAANFLCDALARGVSVPEYFELIILFQKSGVSFPDKLYESVLMHVFMKNVRMKEFGSAHNLFFEWLEMCAKSDALRIKIEVLKSKCCVSNSVLSHILKHIMAKSEINNELNFLPYLINDPFVDHLLLSLNFLELITPKVKDRSMIDSLKGTAVVHSHEYTKFLDGALNFCDFSEENFLENVKREIKKYLADQSVRLAVELKEIERNKNEYIRVSGERGRIDGQILSSVKDNYEVKDALNTEMVGKRTTTSDKNVDKHTLETACSADADQSRNTNNKTAIKSEIVSKNKTDVEELTKKMDDTLPISNSIDVKKVGEDSKTAKSLKISKKPPRRPPGRAMVKKTNPEIVKWRSKNYKVLRLERNKCEIFKKYDEEELMKKFTEDDFVPFIRKMEKVKICNETKETNKGIFPMKKSYALSIALGRVKDADETFIKKIMNLEMVDENVVKQILTYFPTENEISQIKEGEDLGRAEMFYKVVISDIGTFYECLNCILLSYILSRTELMNMIDILENVISYIMVDEFLAEFVNVSLFVANILSKCAIEGFLIDNLNEFIQDENRKLFHLILSRIENAYKRSEYLSQAKAINYDLLCMEYEEILLLHSKIKESKYDLVEGKNMTFTKNIEQIQEKFTALKKSYEKLSNYLGKNIDEKGFALLDKFYEKAGKYYKTSKGC